MMSETVIRLDNISKKFGDLLAVNDVSLEVNKGETIGLVGPNGAGKTTIIKMIAKLLRPTSGRIFIKNSSGELQDLNQNARNLIKTGFLIDIPSFYDMTAYQLLRYFANLQNYPKSQINKRIDELLDLFKLSEWKHKKVKTFSKGMTQKLGIIQALIHDPEIIILDEPQTGLDPKARIEIRKYIRHLQNLGKTIFIASHMLYEISEICDKIALINHGSFVAYDTLENLEGLLKAKEIKCQILKPIAPENLGPIIKKLSEKLDPYLDKDLDPKISKVPIKYNPHKHGFRIFYKGDDETMSNILKVLVKEFEVDFTVHSFTQPKTSQLERIYSQMITDDGEQFNLKKRRGKR